MAFLDLLEYIDAMTVGELKIEEDCVRNLPEGMIEALSARSPRENSVALALKKDPETQRKRFVIFYDQKQGGAQVLFSLCGSKSVFTSSISSLMSLNFR